MYDKAMNPESTSQPIKLTDAEKALVRAGLRSFEQGECRTESEVLASIHSSVESWKQKKLAS